MQLRRMKRGLIFDLDGTLVDSLSGIAAALNRALASNGMPPHPLVAVRRFIGNGARILVQRAVPADTEESFIVAVERAFKDDYEIQWPNGTFPYDGIMPLLEQLQRAGYPLAVLSNKPHEFTTEIVARLFPAIYFTSILGQRAGIAHKPDPAGAWEISRKLGLLPADCTLIGDSIVDIETAHNAGMESIAVTWGFHDREDLLAANPGQIAEDPAQLLGRISMNGRGCASAGNAS